MDAQQLHLWLAHLCLAAVGLSWLGGIRYGFRPPEAVSRLLDEAALLGCAAGVAAWLLGPYALEAAGATLSEAATAQVEIHEDRAEWFGWLLIVWGAAAAARRAFKGRAKLMKSFVWGLHSLALLWLLYLAAAGGAIRHAIG